MAMPGPAGEEIVLEKNIFVDRILPAAVLRGFFEEEMTEYRRPCVAAGESRRPTLTWPREIPIDGEPRRFCRAWRNQIEVVVPGSHFIQEDSPDEIGIALRQWRDGLR
jgi:haloalkane dehalogenase